MQDVKSILESLQKAGLSQSEISRQTGIPQPRLSKWAAGNHPQSANDVLVLARLAEDLTKTAPADGVQGSSK